MRSTIGGFADDEHDDIERRIETHEETPERHRLRPALHQILSPQEMHEISRIRNELRGFGRVETRRPEPEG